MAALVLGLVVSSAASSYFAQRDELNQLCARLVLLDRILAHYGPAAEESRHTLREVVAGLPARIWPQDRAHRSPPPPHLRDAHVLYEGIEQLSPPDDPQR